MSQAADSAGTPFRGREFRAHPFEGDDGSAPEGLRIALARWQEAPGADAMAEVVKALTQSRLLVPLLAEAGEKGLTPEGKIVDKTQELSVVSVQGPDGRPVAVAFSDVAAMASWRSDARPVPVEASKVIAWALEENMTEVVLNPTSAHQCLLRRGALVATLKNTPYVAPWLDPEVLDQVSRAMTSGPKVSWEIESGWALDGGSGPDLVVRVSLPPGIPAERLHHLQQQWAHSWANSAVLNQRVGGIRLQIVAS